MAIDKLGSGKVTSSEPRPSDKTEPSGQKGTFWGREVSISALKKAFSLSRFFHRKSQPTSTALNNRVATTLPDGQTPAGIPTWKSDNPVKLATQAREVMPEHLGLLAKPTLKKAAKTHKLGEGAFGTVYQAVIPVDVKSLSGRPTMLQKPYALKDIHVRNGATSSRAIKNEVSMQRQAIGAVAVFDHKSSLTGKHHQVLMEHAGKDLIGVINAPGQQPILPENLARTVTRQLLEQLADIHSKGMVHKDVKHDNIMLSHRGEAKLADFGLARQNKISEGSPEQVSFKDMAGTAKYVAPEMLEDGVYTSKYDIWSMGIVLLEMLTGDAQELVRFNEEAGGYYFDSEQYQKLRRRIGAHPTLSTEAKHALFYMLNRNPDDRCSAERNC